MRKLGTRGKRLLIAFGIIIIGTALTAFYRWWNAPLPPAEYIPPSVKLEQSRLIGRSAGVRQWEILTQTVSQEGDEITLSEMGEIVIFQDGEPYFHVEAESAVWRRKADILELSGGVVVWGTGPENFTLTTAKMVWEGQGNTLTCPGPTTIGWHGITIQSNHTVIYIDEEKVVFEKQVQMREGEFSWDLHKAVYYPADDILEFFGEMVLIKEEG